MYVERNIVSGHYGTKDFEDSDNEKDSEGYTVWVISKTVNVVTPYTYDEAISIAGNGRYTISLLAVCCLSHLAMCLDMFGFSTIVAGGTCDLEIEPWQYDVLISMPFLGAILTAYVWGYVSDTRGRRFSLIVAMWGGFIATIASAFSPNWIVLAALKFISSSFCSLAQAASYMLIGECCPVKVKRTYFFILSSVKHLALPIYTALGYISLNFSFSCNLGYFTFTSWRLLILCLGAPLGVSAFCLHYFYESPKFLANIGEKGLAMETLTAIWLNNKCVGKKYPVEKLVLEEVGNAATKSMPLLQSLREQTVPLFKKPLLFRALQLYFLNIVVYSTTNSLLIWFPYLASAYISGLSSYDAPRSMCEVIEHSQNLTATNSLSCIPKSDITVVWASTVQGVILAIFNIIIAWVGDRKLLIILMMIIISASAAGCAVLENNTISLLLFFTIFMGSVVNGIVSSYFVDFFPTSYRGMAACLSVVVARASALIGSNVTGFFIISHCTHTFYVIAVNIFCGVLVACFLPSDRVKRHHLKKAMKKKFSF